MRAITICVDMFDLAQITIPYNRHHFSDIMIVTSLDDEKTVEVARRNNCTIYQTNAFYKNEAKFNKWLALEEALSIFGRHCVDPLENWLCLLDIDILWPKSLKIKTNTWNIEYETPTSIFLQEKDQLCSPLRRMMVELPIPFTKDSIPEENTWSKFPIHRNISEHAGYSQIFNTYDKHLPNAPPWHKTNYIHAGCSDSFFQDRWSRDMKVRPNWECLHLGEAGLNWMGRQSNYLDGTKNPKGQQLRSEIMNMWAERRRRERVYKGNKDMIFLPEKINEEHNSNT